MEKVLLILLAASADAQIRLVGPSGCSGRVEVYHNEVWGTVCDDGWDLNDAAVVCRQAGCGLPTSDPMPAYFGEGTEQIWLDDVACVGNENSLPQCGHNGFGNHNCGHEEDVGVICEAIRRKVVRLKVLLNFSLDLKDPELLENLQKQLKQKLLDQGLNGTIVVKWLTSDGQIFRKDGPT